jgi:N-acetylglutamate synthase-like GNAT family acetyltransferase
MDRIAEALCRAVGAAESRSPELALLADELQDAGMLIRRAARDDIAAIASLVGQLSPLGYRHDYTNAELKFEQRIATSPDYFLWVAEIGGEVVGTAMMHLQHKLSYRCGTAGHLEDLVVDAAHRGGNVGTLLVKTAILAARVQGCYKLMLTCYPKTASFYERFGFQQHDIGMRMSLKTEVYDKDE